LALDALLGLFMAMVGVGLALGWRAAGLAGWLEVVGQGIIVAGLAISMAGNAFGARWATRLNLAALWTPLTLLLIWAAYAIANLFGLGPQDGSAAYSLFIALMLLVPLCILVGLATALLVEVGPSP
jgi:hypothetical protein